MSKDLLIHNENDLRSKNSTAKTKMTSKSRSLPYSFTEQGIYMLMTVLRGDLATAQSKALIRIFKQMKDFILQSQNVLCSPELVKLSLQTSENTNEIYHDRYIFIDFGSTDEKIYHCGGSSKDGGIRTTAISQVEDTSIYKIIAKDLQKNPILIV